LSSLILSYHSEETFEWVAILGLMSIEKPQMLCQLCYFYFY
jgi:hypothetical protein